MQKCLEVKKNVFKDVPDLLYLKENFGNLLVNINRMI